MKQISVVLPAYNEEKNISKALSNISEYLESRFSDFEIIVVDDGSKDKTQEIVNKWNKKHKHSKLVSHSKNKGYGAALRSGFEAAQGKLIFYTDSDNQYDIQELDKLLEAIKTSDIVAGYRLHHSDPLTRIAISKMYNILIWAIFGLDIKDIDCSFKLYKKSVFEKIKLSCDTGLIDVEVLLKAQKQGFTISQLGVNHYPRTAGQSIYEVGRRNKIFALVHPSVPINIFKEINKYWSELT